VAASNDIATLAYNPASLGTMKGGQASFLYQKGFIDDSYGQFLVGSSSRHGGFGLSVGYYDAGTFDMSTGGAQRSVTAQRDLVFALSTARNVGPVSIGTTGKYISSEIAETARASAYAADLGLSVSAGHGLRLGAAVQNIGTKLRYVDHGDDLPRTARGGAALSFGSRGLNATFLVDGTYRMIEKSFEPGAGLEIGLGILALRAGYRGGDDKQFSVGTGFYTGRASIDYAFGVTSQNLDATHRISYSMRFGGNASVHDQLARKKVETPAVAAAPAVRPAPVTALSSTAPRQAIEIAGAGAVRRIPRTYEIRPGDTLASIARAQYGDPRLWRSIYQANSYLLGASNQTASLPAGQKIVLP
jgi:hypothetical protein